MFHHSVVLFLGNKLFSLLMDLGVFHQQKNKYFADLPCRSFWSAVFYLLKKFFLCFQEKSWLKMWWNKVISEPYSYCINDPMSSAEEWERMASTQYSQYVAGVHSQGPQLCPRSHGANAVFDDLDHCAQKELPWHLPLCFSEGSAVTSLLPAACCLPPHKVQFQYQPLPALSISLRAAVWPCLHTCWLQWSHASSGA